MPLRPLMIAMTAAGVGIASSLIAVPAVHADTTPQVGDCYNYSDKEAKQRVTTSPKVDCSTKHRGETFYVGQVSANFPPPRKVKAKDATREAMRNCTTDRMNTYLGITDKLPTRFAITAHFPGQTDWAAGARWVRCDLTLRLGTSTQTWNGPAPQYVAETNRAALNFCTPSVGFLAWPDPRRTKAQRCTAPKKQWILVGEKNLGAASARYPGQRTIDQRANKKCKPLRNSYPGGLPAAQRGWFYIYPTAAGWARGERDALCWVPLKQYQDSTRPTAPVEPAPGEPAPAESAG